MSARLQTQVMFSPETAPVEYSYPPLAQGLYVPVRTKVLTQFINKVLDRLGNEGNL